MAVSIREVASHAGVSVATVSNVLNRPEIVAQQTRDRVNASIRQLGFVRNESARQLRAGHSRTIGLVVLDVANTFFTDVARGVEDEASKAGLAVILCNSDDQERKEKRYLELLEAHRVQGVLITPVAGAGSRLIVCSIFSSIILPSRPIARLSIFSSYSQNMSAPTA